jgi:NAD(P)-dependent dehydrogenase (short-subunit alcohol dehydrogenase family)
MLEGQVALVTGAGRGIGKTIALRFAREGADIAVLDVHRESAEATAREVASLGRRAAVKVADVSDVQAVQAAVSEVVAELGRLDVLMNNAGIETRTPFLEIRPEDWRRQLDVNLSGTFYCTQAAARAAALDLAGYGITVNAIAPGPIETELMLGAWSAEALRERPQHGAITRFGTVDEIAQTALFLAAPESSFMTGTTVSVDGGAVAAGAYMVEKYRRRKAAERAQG